MRFDRMALSMLRAYFLGTGPGTVVPGGLHAFVKTRPELAVPDIEFMFRGVAADAHLWFPLVRPPYQDTFGIRPTLLHPDSRGEVLLRSADPRDPVRIHYNFFSAPNDLPTLREGVRRGREVAYQEAMAPFRGEETSPGPGVHTDAEIDAWIRKTTITAHHPAGSCQMGQWPDSVVDPQLRVHGIERLRVADASIMPSIVAGNTNAPSIMIGEKCADMVRQAAQ
jgi:4-pyridoxate dehydrogenase